MRKMKKILAWLTVLTVNVSMMPMPTVAAATAADTDTSTASSEATDVTKEATQAQEAAAKAVEKASKAATTTAANKTTTATKKTTSNKKAKSAASTQSLQDTIEEGIFQDRDNTKVDVSDYDASKSEVKKATKEVLKDNNASKLVTVTYDTNSNGDVESVNVNTDAAFMAAMDEIDEIDEADGDTKNEHTVQECYQVYGALQQYYEANPDYFGIAAPYFSSKDTEGASPIRALLAVMNIEFDEENNKFINTATNEDQEVTVDYVYNIIGGFYQALVEMTDKDNGSMYQQYGAQLLKVRDQALKVVEGKKTTAEKLLALNDWLGNYATFDMGYINNQMKNDITGGSDSSSENKTEQEQFMELVQGVCNSSAFGVLTGNRTSVCLSYTSAYNYLVQCAFPEIYKKKNEDGSYGDWKKKTDINGTWEPKTDADGKIETVDGKKQYQLTSDSAEPTYMVDYVRIQWNSKVKMYGVKQDFNNPHYFSAVKVPNKSGEEKWYYVDSCYNDIYVECLQRNRVETDGNLPHSYFLISDKSLREQFDGNYQYIDTLYKDDSTDDTYENSWVSKAQGPVYNDGTYYYYVKDTSTYSTSGSNINYQEGNDQLVRRKMSDGLLSGDDEVLVDYKTGDGLIKEGKDLITEGYKQDADVNDKKYPGLTHSAALYNKALYLNLDNKILKYDLDSNAVTVVKEYNEVSAKQDESKTDFPGMSFTITTNDDKDKVHTVYNHPIAGLAIKDDGKMYVSIATNFTDCAKYKYEETNYNSEYMDYTFNGQHYQRGGDNDNQEFMWSANFTEALDMSHVAGTSHDYETVTVAPTCKEDGYTEERCKTCGEIKADSKKSTDEKATGHHYIKAHEFYYTPKDENQDYSETNRNEGDFYLCTECLDAQDSLPSGETAGHTYGNATAEFNDDYTSAKVTVSCTVCDGKELDALLDDQNKDTQEITKTADTTDIKVERPDDFDCEKGGEITYVATATIDGKEYKASKKVTVEAGAHVCGEPKFTWSDDNTKCTATYTCTICGKEITKDCTVKKETTAATCEADGKTTYTATVKLNDSAKEYTDTKTEEIKATGHDYGEPAFKWSDDNKTCEATFTCKNDEKHVQTETCKVAQETTKAVTCTEDGEIIYTATCEFNGKTYTNEKKETVKATGHDYGEPTYQWSKDDDGNKVCVATFECKQGDDKQLVMVKQNADSESGTLKAETTAATCEAAGKTTYTATIKFNDKTYTATTTEETSKATGHKYGEPTFKWSEDNKTCEATFICENDKTHVETVKAEVTEKTDDATCETAGKVTYTATAKLGDKTYTDTKTVEGQALGHKYGEPTFKWSDDGKTCEATFTCERDKHVETVKADVTEKTVEATCDAEGKTVHTAKVTFEGKDYTDTKDTDVTAKLGHKYGEPTFKWADDGKTCEATFTCERDSHVETVKAEVTDKVIAPTCTEEGKTVHTAKVTFEGKDYTSTKDTDTTQPTGHKYGKPAYKWSDDGKTCDVVFTCENNKEHVETVKAEVTDEVIAPTCTKEGKTVHTAKATFEGKEYTSTKDTDTTQPTGHKYGEDGICTVCGHVKPTITLKDKKAVYTGKAISIDKPEIKGDVENLNYSYYSDKACKNEISEPTDPGVYYVRVTADAGSEDAGVTSNTVTLTINPQATKVTSVANASSYVTVSWNKVSKASGYYVYRSTDGKKFTKVATVKSYKTVKYNDKKATKNGQKYVYKVVAYYNGNQTVSSAYSNAKTGYRLSTMKVSSLTNKKGKKLSVKWAKNSKSTGYQIEYVTGKTTKKVNASAKSKSKTISKLKKGKTYYVRIRSYKKVSGTTYYGAWSSKKKVKIKK